MQTQNLMLPGIFLLTAVLALPLSSEAVTRIWNDAGDGQWNNALNWNGTGIPEPGDDVVFGSVVSNCNADCVTNNLRSITLLTNYTGNLTFRSNCVEGANVLNLAADLVISGGTMVCEGDTNPLPSGAGIIINASNIIVGLAGKLSANGKGFPMNSGPGKGAPSGGGWEGSGGAGHGGRGGAGAYGAAGGTNYGSATAPVSLGSGGGENGGAGGGAIKLVSTGGITVDGTVSADGINASGGKYGGGSGGSLWIAAGTTLGGNGTISAKGGKGWESGGTENYGGGGGGGGRIKISYGAKTFTGTITAKGGTKGGVGDGSGPEKVGCPGTVSIPDNESMTVTADIALSSGTYTIPALLVTNGATLCLQSDPVTSNGVTIKSIHLAVASDALISCNGQGFPAATGPGRGTNETDSWHGGGGGGHGGTGGDGGGNPGSGGQTNDSQTAPVLPGSGGGISGNKGGYGGGAMRLVSYGTMTINGTLSANGEGIVFNGTPNGGNGSGGSIWITAKTLDGTGTVSAVGGSGGSSVGGGGGGGRIAVEYTYYASNLNISVTGGTIDGQTGTIYYRFIPSQGTILVLR